MKNNHINEAETSQVSFVTPLRLWNFLFQGNRDGQRTTKMTKADAFYDLLKRQQLYLATLEESCVGGSCISLAKAWNWDRATVKKFLDELVRLDVITLTRTKNRTTISLLNLIKDDELAGVLNNQPEDSSASSEENREMMEEAAPPDRE